MTVGLRKSQVFDHGEPHRLRRPESEKAGIADVQRDDLVATFFQRFGTVCELAANFIANACQSLADRNRCLGHSDCSGGGQFTDFLIAHAKFV